jgi:type I restriction enzyme S subunit
VPAFLGNILKSTIGQSYFDAAQYGIKQGLSLEDIREVPVVLPPIDEQLAILDSLDKTIGSIESVRSRIDVGIDRLQEYRTSLISAAVTGQIDVRKEVQLEE